MDTRIVVGAPTVSIKDELLDTPSVKVTVEASTAAAEYADLPEPSETIWSGSNTAKADWAPVFKDIIIPPKLDDMLAEVTAEPAAVSKPKIGKYNVENISNIDPADGNGHGNKCRGCKGMIGELRVGYFLRTANDHVGAFIEGWYCKACITICAYMQPHAVPRAYWLTGNYQFCPRCAQALDAGNSTPFKSGGPTTCCPCTGNAKAGHKCYCVCHPEPKELVVEGKTFRMPPQWFLEALKVDGLAPSQTETHPEAIAKWGIDNEMSPAQAMAEFYIVDSVRHGIVNRTMVPSEDATTLQIEAMLWQQEHLPQFAETFARYMTMVAGGELRHHPGFKQKNIFNPHRTYSWGQWFDYCERYGHVRMLAVAADWFKDWGFKTGFGGMTWSLIASTACDYRSGKINVHQFCDRAFTLEHNNGSMFNKIHWGIDPDHDMNASGYQKTKEAMYATTRGVRWVKPNIRHMKERIGPAHAANPTDWASLFEFAGDEVRDLFCRAWRAGNRARISSGERPVMNPIDAGFEVEGERPAAGVEDLLSAATWRNAIKIRNASPSNRRGVLLWDATNRAWWFRVPPEGDSPYWIWHLGNYWSQSPVPTPFPKVSDSGLGRARVWIAKYRKKFPLVSEQEFLAHVADQIWVNGILYPGDWNWTALHHMQLQNEELVSVGVASVPAGHTTASWKVEISSYPDEDDDDDEYVSSFEDSYEDDEDVF